MEKYTPFPFPRSMRTSKTTIITLHVVELVFKGFEDAQFCCSFHFVEIDQVSYPPNQKNKVTLKNSFRLSRKMDGKE